MFSKSPAGHVISLFIFLSSLVLIGCGGKPKDNYTAGADKIRKHITLTGKQISDHSVRLDWEFKRDFDSSSISIEMRTGDELYYKTIAESLNMSISTYTYDEIKPGEIYYFRIRESSRTDFGSMSDPWILQSLFSAPILKEPEVLTDHEVRLGWEVNNPMAISVEIERQDIGLFKRVATVNASESSWMDTTLASNRDYKYRVRCKGERYYSSYSDIVNVNTQLPPPSDLSIEIIDGDKVVLSWIDKSGWADTFYVYRRKINEDFRHIQTLPSNMNRFSDFGLEYNTSYLYKLKARSAGNFSGFSEPEDITIKIKKLEKPEAKLVGKNALELKWKKPESFVKGYRIIRKEKGIVEDKIIAQLPPDSISFVDTTIAAGTRYIYIVNPLYSGDLPDLSNRVEYYIPDISSEMVFIGSGSVNRRIDSLGSWYGDKYKKVEVNAFYISRHEITNREYQLFIDETGHKPPPSAMFENMDNYFYDYPDYPVVMVNWYDAVEYCNWLSKRMGLEPAYGKNYKFIQSANGYRLPRENQFIKIYQDMYGLNGVSEENGNFFGNRDGYPTTSPAGKLTGGGKAYPVWDIVGNVAEWLNDKVMGRGQEMLELRKIIGGDWSTSQDDFDIEFTLTLLPSNRFNHVGFRVILPGDYDK
ncbi:MAG: SUMF1/EgtB/PvdO family nonheme iron enzyme [candidate division Zixibacteria bacterium]|nr:SUMF1/EgtB/PvdO family nonheme iron enzyme [candidate division Zixibacteria bacterium]